VRVGSTTTPADDHGTVTVRLAAGTNRIEIDAST
jgi:hypothetical protein